MAEPALLRQVVRKAWVPLALICLVGLATLFVALFMPAGIQTVWNEILVRIILVIGFYVFIGNSGIFAFGHVAFACIGGYVAVWLTMDPMFKQIMLSGLPKMVQETQLSPVFGVIAAAGAAGFAALLIGIAIVRLSDIAASIATFAFLIIINRVYSNWDSVTGGVAPLTNIPAFGGLWTVFIFVAVVIVVAYLFQESRSGLMLRASREDEVAARAAGISVFRVRLQAFVISAAIMGCGGALYSYFLSILTVDVFYMSLTFLLLVMLVLGGAESLTGAILGVVVVSCVAEVLRTMERGVALPFGQSFTLPLGMQEICLGALMVLVLIFRSSGLTKGREIPLPQALQSPDDGPAR